MRTQRCARTLRSIYASILSAVLVVGTCMPGVAFALISSDDLPVHESIRSSSDKEPLRAASIMVPESFESDATQDDELLVILEDAKSTAAGQGLSLTTAAISGATSAHINPQRGTDSDADTDAANKDAANKDATKPDAANKDAANAGVTNANAANPGAANADATDTDAANADDATSFILNAQQADIASEEDLEVVIDGEGALDAVVKAHVPEGIDAHTYAEQLADLPGVIAIQPNYRYKLIDDIPADKAAEEIAAAAAQSMQLSAQQALTSDEANDPLLWRQYYLGDYQTQYGANVVNAWQKAKTNYAVTVAVLDTGCRVTHTDLVENIDTVNMWDAYTGTVRGRIASNEVPYGDNIGHGTHVCGIVSAQANNEVGIAGASYNATVLPIKVFNNNYDPYCESDTADIIKAYNYLFNLVDAGEVDNLHVINMSLGGYDTEEDDVLFEEAIAKAREDYDILSVCAGGNGDSSGTPLTEPSYPSDFEPSISVTALDTSGYNASFSDYNRYKDISAPGVALLSTYYNNDSDYESLSGTSMASPLVSGIFALLWAFNPDLSADEAWEAVKETALPVRVDSGVRDRSKTSGSAGAIDAAAALEYAALHFPAGVQRTPLDSASVQAEIEEIPPQFYTGKPVEPSVKVHLTDGTALTLDKDYRVAFAQNTRIGTATVYVTGRGLYSGRLQSSFPIYYDMQRVVVNDVAPSYAYEGKGFEARPIPRVTYENRPLTNGVDYTVSYVDNDKPGTGHLLLEGQEPYYGIKDVPFSITTLDMSQAMVRGLANAYSYTGRAIEPAFDVLYNGRLLAQDWDYTITWSNNSAVGSATVAIEGINEFSGCLEKTFSIVLPKTIQKANPLKVAGKKLSVKASKVRKSKKVLGAGVKVVAKGVGALSYARAGGSSALVVNAKTGKITVKKGTKRGAYTLKIRVKAAGNTVYAPATKTVTVKVRVK